MLGALAGAVRVGDLRKRILYTAAMLLVFRLGSFIPVPGVNARALAEGLGVGAGSIFGFLDMFSGGSLGRFSIFAMGVNPYITASIVLQLLTIVIPRLEELSKEGTEGRKQIQQYTRYGTVLLGIVQGIGITFLASGQGVLTNAGVLSIILIVLTLTAGATFLMWLGEKITEHGIGNGISLLIFAGIIAELPIGFIQAVRAVGQGGISPLSLVAFVVLAVVVVAGIVLVQEGQRRIPVQYPRRVVGRRMVGGATTHIPLRVNTAGVIPIIFASSVLIFPLTVAQFWPQLGFLEGWIGFGTPGYLITFVIAVFFFTYFYTAVTWNPSDVASNMKKNGGLIPGVRPGRPTADYLDRVLTRITLAGAVFLSVIAVLPQLMSAITQVPITFLTFGGTGLLIVVGVALDTMKQIEGQLLMRHYEGFIK